MPQRRVRNEELATFLDTSDEWIRTRTGIEERRVLSGDEKLEDLAFQAAQTALSRAKLQARELDYILCSNVVSEHITPGLGTIVQGLLGASCPSLDLNAACAGFIYALQVAQGLLKSGSKTILILCAEMNSRLCDWTDRRSCVLFGDGAAAAIVTSGGEDFLFQMTTQSNSSVLYAKNQPGNSPFQNPWQAEYLTMNGQEVYKFAVAAACKGIRSLLELAGLQTQSIRYFLIHQANLRIIQSVREKLGLDPSLFPTNIQRYGNTSSVSIPLLLEELFQSGELKPGDQLVFSAFGAGLQTGCCLLSLA
jgi:3-oxoacyl-[acyl-carrier-protein] synthase-3